MEQTLLDPVKEGLPVERGRDGLHDKCLDHPDNRSDEHGGEESGDVVEDLGSLSRAAQLLLVEELRPGDEHKTNPEAGLHAVLEPKDEVEHLVAEQEVALDEEDDEGDEPLADEVAGEDGDDHDAPLPDLQPPHEVALERARHEADDEQREEEDEHGELERDAGPAAALGGGGGGGRAVLAEDVVVVVALARGLRGGDGARGLGG